MCAVVTSLSAVTPACRQTRLPCIWNLDFGKLFAGQEIHSRNTPHRPAYFFGKRLRYFWYLIKTWSWNILKLFSMNTKSQILSIFRMTALIFSECFCVIKILLCRAANTKGIAGKSSRSTRPPPHFKPFNRQGFCFPPNSYFPVFSISSIWEFPNSVQGFGEKERINVQYIL